MRWSFIVPARIELDCDVPAWLDLVSLSRLALEWAAERRDQGSGTGFSKADILPGGTLAGVLAYACGVAACIQYHTWARRGEWEGAVVLERLASAAERWAGSEGVLMQRVSQLKGRRMVMTDCRLTADPLSRPDPSCSDACARDRRLWWPTRPASYPWDRQRAC